MVPASATSKVQIGDAVLVLVLVLTSPLNILAQSGTTKPATNAVRQVGIACCCK